MHVLSINRGDAEPIANAKASGMTGIYKRPIDEAVTVTEQGLVGDAICDIENHGGADQAIYVYGLPDYVWWESALGRKLAPGTFGENLTITDLESASLVIGDRLQIGRLMLEVTAPRMPCVTLARRMDDPMFLKRFRAAERPGVYCRVVQEGTIQAGDSVVHQPYHGNEVSVLELFRDAFDPQDDQATIRRHLAAPIDIRTRRVKEQQLARLQA